MGRSGGNHVTDHDDEHAPYARHLLDTRTAEVMAIIIGACIVLGAVVVVAALAGWLPW